MSVTIEDAFKEWLDENGDSVITDHVDLDDVVGDHVKDYVKDTIDEDLMGETMKEKLDDYLGGYDFEPAIKNALADEINTYVNDNFNEEDSTAILREECRKIRDDDISRLIAERIEAAFTLRGFGKRIDDLSAFCDNLQNEAIYTKEKVRDMGVGLSSLFGMFLASLMLNCFVVGWLCWVLF